LINQSTLIKRKTIAITGASGYIGSALTFELLKLPVNILRISRKKISTVTGTEDLILDLNEKESWQTIVSRADIIFHLAGNTSIYLAEEDPEENKISTIKPINLLIDASKELSQIPRVIFTSTVTVYGLTDKFPVTENTIPIPLTVYDEHKLEAEKILANASEASLINATSIRLSNVYGPSIGKSSSADRGVFNKIAKNAFIGKDISIFGDGNYIRDYIYIDDVVSALIKIAFIDNVEYSSLNLVSGVGVKIKDAFKMIADEVFKFSGTEVNIKKSPWPDNLSPIELRNFIGSNIKLSKIADWSPQYNLKKGIVKLVNFIGEAEDS